jgi:phenylacetate-CoA ligase
MNWIQRLLSSIYVVARGRVERTVPFWPFERMERLQRYRLRKIIRHAYETVPFYRQAMDERGLRPGDFRTVDDLAKLPLIDGLMVQRNVEAFLSTRYNEDSRVVLHSSGSSSGIRRGIYWDKTSFLAQRAIAVRDQVVVTSIVGNRPHVSVHIVAPGSDTYVVRAFLQSSTLNRRGYGQHHIVPPEQPFELVAERLNSVQPQLVASNSSYAEQFFRFLADRQMSITPPRVWIYGADMLSARGKDLIENTFGCPTYSTYRATEALRLGFQCEQRQGFHLNVDLCSLRIVDEAGRTLAPGELGEVVISNLHNRAMVLLNYRLDDWGVMAQEPCSCGRSLPLLERLEGRSSEILQLADGRIISSLSLDASCYDALKPTLQVQIVHPAPGHIRWRIVPSSGADPDTLRRDLLERCRVVLGEDTKVEVEFVDEIPSTPQGKFLRVVSQAEARDAPDSITQGDK